MCGEIVTYCGMCPKSLVYRPRISIHLTFKVRIGYLSKKSSVIENVLCEDDRHMHLCDLSPIQGFLHMTNTYLALLDFSQFNSRNGKSVSGVDIKRIVTRLDLTASFYTHASSVLARQIILSIVPTSIPEALAGTTLQPSASISYGIDCTVIFCHSIIKIGEDQNVDETKCLGRLWWRIGRCFYGLWKTQRLSSLIVFQSSLVERCTERKV